jgi:hypothetical protein
MSARQGLGDLFNLATSATTALVRANLEQSVGATIVLIGASSGNATLQEANAASGGTIQNIGTGVTVYYTQNNGVWTKTTQGAAATVTAVTGALLAVYFPAVQFSSGFKYIAATHASGSFVYILHELQGKRTPENLKAVTS